jgi:hypothetical protein
MLLIDFTFACPWEGSRSGNIDNGRLTAAAAKLVGRAAKIRYNGKMKKYEKVINRFHEADLNRNVETFTVVPFVMETTGFIHEKGIELLEKIAHRRQQMKRHHKKDSLSYFLNLLSVCYHTQMARAIIKRVAQVSGHHRVQPSGIVDYIIQDENAVMLVVILALVALSSA